MAIPTPTSRAKKLLKIILVDDAERLEKIDEYKHGTFDGPYRPDTATAEYDLLAERANSTNLCAVPVRAVVQACYVDNFRPGRESAGEAAEKKITPEWKHWQESRLDSRQFAVVDGACTFGHSFTITERVASGKVLTKGLSARNTAALYVDPANDEDPTAALTITDWPGLDEDSRGSARMWDDTYEYLVTFRGTEKVSVKRLKRHGNSVCPVTRFSIDIDLEGRTLGLVEPVMGLQDRINQTVFDLLVAQTYGSFKVRYVTGMAPPVKMRVVNEGTDDEEEIPELDSNGQVIPLPTKLSTGRMLYAEDEKTKFGTLDETALDGYINSIEMSFSHFSAVTNVSPVHLLGKIANLSAEALQAADINFSRMVKQIQTSLGESWERDFRLAAELNGDEAAYNDYAGEVIWADMEARSLAADADALGKLRQNVEAPIEGLWEMLPGMTQNRLRRWKELKDAEPDEVLSQALRPSRPTASGGRQVAKAVGS